MSVGRWQPQGSSGLSALPSVPLPEATYVEDDAIPGPAHPSEPALTERVVVTTRSKRNRIGQNEPRDEPSSGASLEQLATQPPTECERVAKLMEKELRIAFFNEFTTSTSSENNCLHTLAGVLHILDCLEEDAAQLLVEKRNEYLQETHLRDEMQTQVNECPKRSSRTGVGLPLTGGLLLDRYSALSLTKTSACPSALADPRYSGVSLLPSQYWCACVDRCLRSGVLLPTVSSSAKCDAHVAVEATLALITRAIDGAVEEMERLLSPSSTEQGEQKTKKTDLEEPMPPATNLIVAYFPSTDLQSLVEVLQAFSAEPIPDSPIQSLAATALERVAQRCHRLLS